jgi:molybdopterin-guanine dinucleotide biosynthesis protein B
MKVFAIAGYHNTGKTALAERLVNALRSRGYRVGYIKHDPKGHGVTDREGSDTWRISRCGVKTALLSPGRLTLWENREDDPLTVVREYFGDCDVVILEGYKKLGGVPKLVMGELEADEVLLRVDEHTELDHIIELIERMEENL